MGTSATLDKGLQETQAWLESMGTAQAFCNLALAIIHPSQYVLGATARQQRLCNLELVGHKPWMTLWTSAFTKVNVNVENELRAFRSTTMLVGALELLACVGGEEDCMVELPGLKINMPFACGSMYLGVGRAIRRTAMCKSDHAIWYNMGTEEVAIEQTKKSLRSLDWARAEIVEAAMSKLGM